MFFLGHAPSVARGAAPGSKGGGELPERLFGGRVARQCGDVHLAELEVLLQTRRLSRAGPLHLVIDLRSDVVRGHFEGDQANGERRAKAHQQKEKDKSCVQVQSHGLCLLRRFGVFVCQG